MSRFLDETLPLSAFGDLRTIELSPQFQGSFEYTVDNTDLFEKMIGKGWKTGYGNFFVIFCINAGDI